MATRGGAREGSGRKAKADEQHLIEKLSPLEPLAFNALEKGLMAGRDWAVKMYFEYVYGKPKAQMDITTDGQAFNPTQITFKSFKKDNE